MKIQVDACFLSNPYATDLFLQYVNDEIISTNRLKTIVANYPAQNRVIAERLAKHFRIPAKNFFVGNGATEIIQAILQRSPPKKLLITLPTFSPYYEFVTDDTTIAYHHLHKESGFQLDVEEYIQRVESEKPDTIVLVNPNNPDGGYISQATLYTLLDRLRWVTRFIIDESFIHFAFESEDYALQHNVPMIHEFENLIIIKSMSKDFGIAGIRAGFAAMAEERVSQLLKNGYLWNVSGWAEFFFQLHSRDAFQRAYENIRVRYIRETQEFFATLSKLPGLKVYPSKANFALVELTSGMLAADLVAILLIRHGIYVRNCSDKRGLEGKFVRIASRTQVENRRVLDALCAVLG